MTEGRRHPGGLTEPWAFCNNRVSRRTNFRGGDDNRVQLALNDTRRTRLEDVSPAVPRLCAPGFPRACSGPRSSQLRRVSSRDLPRFAWTNFSWGGTRAAAASFFFL